MTKKMTNTAAKKLILGLVKPNRWMARDKGMWRVLCQTVLFDFNGHVQGVEQRQQ